MIGAIVVAQRAAPAMQAAGSGTIIVTGGGFADHPVPALASVSLGKAALRSAATILRSDLKASGIRVATLTDGRSDLAGRIPVPPASSDHFTHADGKLEEMSRIFITGSTDGLGLMAARLLVDDGHEVRADVAVSSVGVRHSSTCLGHRVC